MNIMRTNELCRFMHARLGMSFVWFVVDGKSYSYNVNRFGAYAAKNGLRMRSKKLLIVEDETTAPLLAAKLSFYK